MKRVMLFAALMLLATPTMAQAAGAKITWTNPASVDLKGILLFRTTDRATTPTLVLDVETSPTISVKVKEAGDNILLDTSSPKKLIGYEDNTLLTTKRYWYIIRAYDFSGNISEPAAVRLLWPFPAPTNFKAAPKQ